MIRDLIVFAAGMIAAGVIVYIFAWYVIMMTFFGRR